MTEISARCVPRSFKNKKVLVVVGTGLIGSPLVDLLIEENAKVKIVSLDHPSRANPKAEFRQLDLREPRNCLEACADMEFVFSLFGVEGYLYTSSIGAYPPAEVFKEESVWSGPPSPNDRFAGWAKRMGELQAEAYKIEYGWDDITTVYPANVYGPFDNFDSENAMVVPSLIKRAIAASESGQPLVAWSNGSPIRDFIHAKDVALGMMVAVKNAPGHNYNIGSGVGTSIKQLTDIIVNNLPQPVQVQWDTDAPLGDNIRLMNTYRIRSIGFVQQISLEEGIKDTINWYLKNKNETSKRYDPFDTV